MPQALRQPREPERSRLWNAVLLLFVLSFAVTIPGCASSWLANGLLADSSLLKQTPSTIRSQSSTESNTLPQNEGTLVEADYRPRKTVTPSIDGEAADEIASEGIVPIYASGHSFVKRRARLGRPVMLPLDPNASTPMRDGSAAAENANPTLGNAGISSAKTSTLPNYGNSRKFSETTAPLRSLSLGEAGWQGIPQSKIAETSTEVPTDELVGDSSFPDGWKNGSQSSLAIPGTSNNARTADRPRVDHEVDPTNEASVGPDGDVLNDDAATASGIDEVSPKEPGVFDRLRGLYIPRREDIISERTRKTARRWTDPFGLLRERDPENVNAAVGATSPLPEPVEAETTSVDTPAAQVSAPGSEDLLGPLIAQLEQELSEWPRLPNGIPRNEAEWRRRQTDLRMLYLVAGRAAESIRVIEALPEKEQEFWQSMMLAVDAYRRTDDSTERSEHLAETLDYVRAASRQLQPLSSLKIRRLNFCNRIDGFGMFNVFPTSEFNAGQPLLLYAEIENYKSEMSPDGQYRSEFAAMIEFLRAGETEPIASRTIRLPEIEDLCATERTDYFQSYELTVPSLSPGKYTLRLRVRDQFSLQTATTDLPFEIRPLGSSRTER